MIQREIEERLNDKTKQKYESKGIGKQVAGMT